MSREETKMCGEESLIVKEVGSDFDDKWIKFISGNPQATVYHHPLWFKIIEKESGQKVLRLVCTNGSNEIVGVLPLQYTKGIPFKIGGLLGAKRLSSLPRTPIGGPIVINPKASVKLIQESIKIASKESDRLLQIKAIEGNINNEIEVLNQFLWREIYIKEIPDYPDEIRFGNSKNHTKIKWAVNKAIRNNIVYRIAETDSDLKKWYILYLNTMRYHITPARSYKFFKSLWEILRPEGLMKLALAELESDGQKIIIAGSVLFYYNNSVIYAFNGSSRKREHFELRPNDLIHWQAILDAQREGYKTYNFGEVSKDHSGLAAYKKKWGSSVLDMYHYYYPKFAQLEADELDTSIKRGIKEKIWNRLPLSLTAKFGEMIYKRL